MADESTLVSELPPEQRQELQSQIENPKAPLSPIQYPQGDDLIDSLSPQELADVSIQTKGAGFDPAQWASANPDVSPEKFQKAADALALLNHRGFKISDIDLWDSTKNLLKMIPAAGKWAGTALELGVVTPLAHDIFKASLRTPGEEAEFEKIRAKKSAELLASTELSVTGLAELGAKALKKVSRATGFLKDPLDQTPQERLDNLWGAVGMAKQRENISKGHGTAVGALLEGPIADMEKSGIKVDPDVVNDLAAGDPVSFLAFPGGFKVITGVGRAGGKLLAKVASRTEAVQLVTALRGAQRAAAIARRAEIQAGNAAAKGLESELTGAAKIGAEAFPEQQGGLTVEATPGLSASLQEAAEKASAAKAAEQTLVTSEANVAASPVAKLVERARAIPKGIVEAREAISKAVGGATQRAVDIGLGLAPLTVGLTAKTAEAVGATVRQIIPPLATPHFIRTGTILAGKIGGKALTTAKQLFTGAAEPYSPSMRLISDVARGVPSIASGAAKGFLTFDVPLAAVTSETPADTAHMAVFGSFFGALGKVPSAAGRVVQNQLIAPRAWGNDAALRDYRNFSALDAANKFSVDQAKDSAKTQWLSGIREFLKPTDAQMYWVSDEKMFRDALQRYVPGKDPGWYDEAAQQRGVTLNLLDDAGKPQKVILLRDVEAAPHEAIHPFQDVLGERAMKIIDDLVYDEYAPVWDQVGLNYALKFFGPKKMAEYQSRGENWQEALLDATSGTSEWRNTLTPDQIDKTANLYVARELSAEIGDAILRNAGPNLAENKSFPGKLARILGKTMVGFGLEPFEGARTEGQGIPLTMETTENLRQTLKGGIEAVKIEKARPDIVNIPGYGAPKVKVTPRGATPEEPPTTGTPPVPPGTPPVPPGEPGGAADDARGLIPTVPDEPTIRGGRSQREILSDVADAIASGEGLSVDYMSAPGEPAGAITSNRIARRDIIELFRTMPAASRALWEKTFFPDQVIKSGEKIQIIGWSPEVFAANAHKLAKALTEENAVGLSRYEIDKNTGSFTERGWRELYIDATNFVKNQQAGKTGAGGPLVVPTRIVEKGFFPPRVEGEAGYPLDQYKADMISALFGIPIPKTPRIGKVYPRNLIGQEVSEATLPGRVSVPVVPRGPFAGARAEALGIEGQTLKEVNPFRAELEAQGIQPSFIEALQRLNLENIADASPTPTGTAPFRGNEFTLQAGFQPKLESTAFEATRKFQPGDIKRFSELEPEDFVAKIREANRPMTQQSYDLGRASTAEDIPPLQKAEKLAKEKFQQAMEADDMNAAVAAASQKQFFNEAIRYRVALDAAQGITDPIKLREIEKKFGVGDLTPEHLIDAGMAFQPKTNAGKALEDRGLVLERSGHTGYRSLTVKNDRGGVIGEIISSRRPEDAETVTIGGVSVTRPYRNQGIAEILYRELLTDLQADGVRRISGAIVSPAPIKIRNRLMGPGATDYFSEGKAMSVDQALERLSPDAHGRSEIGGLNAMSRLEPEMKFQPKPNDEVRKIANIYAKSSGISYKPSDKILDVKPDVAKKLADFYEKAKDAPTDPEVAASYDALAKETIDQYNAIADAGYVLEPFSGKGEPYKSSDEMTADIRDNKHLFYLPTKENFIGAKNNPMLQSSGIGDAPVNDIFRAVHDFFGHAKGGYQFGPRGELNAWRAHSEMYSPEAQGALAAETLAQNSWVNFGKHLRNEADNIPVRGERGYVPLPDRPFAEQKTIIVPQELIDEVKGGDEAKFTPRKKAPDELKFIPTSFSAPSKAWILPDGTPVQIGGQWHHDWLDQHPEVQKKYDFKVPPFEGNDAENAREAALKAGFARVNYESKNGKMTVEARAKDWRKLKNTVFDMVERNVNAIDSIGIHLLDEVASPKAVDSGYARLFDYDTEAEKLQHIPFITGSETRFQPGRKNKGYTAAEYWAGKSGLEEAPDGHEQWVIDKFGGKHSGGQEGTEGERYSNYDVAEKQGYVRVIFFGNSIGVEPTGKIKQWNDIPKKSRDQIEDLAFDRNVSVDFGQDRIMERPRPDELSRFQPRSETESLRGFETGRTPLSPAERASMTRQEIRDHFPEAVVPRANNESLPSRIMKSPLYKKSGSEVAAVKAFADRLVDFSKKYKDSPAYGAGLKWYSDLVPQLKKEFGNDSDLMAELLSATSPQTPPNTNFGFAFDALQSFRAGRFDKIISKFEEGMVKLEDGSWEAWYERNIKSGNPTPAAFLANWINKFNLKPRSAHGKLYGQHSLPVLKVLARRWIDSNAGPKTKNFVENLMGKSNEATIDLWADRTMRWAGYEGFQDRWRILPENRAAVSEEDFSFSQKVFRAAAEKLGLKPSELQGALWFAEKQRWADSGWGYLNFGSFQTEISKLPALKAGFEHRMTAQKLKSKIKSTEQMKLDVEPRFK